MMAVSDLVLPVPHAGTPTIVVDAVGMSSGSPIKKAHLCQQFLLSGMEAMNDCPGGVSGGWLSGYKQQHGGFHQTSADPQNLTSAPVYCVLTATPTPNLRPDTVPAMSVIINEVAWAGTVASSR